MSEKMRKKSKGKPRRIVEIQETVAAYGRDTREHGRTNQSGRSDRRVCEGELPESGTDKNDT